MTKPPKLTFLLDTPNVWRGRALAGTPARVLALAENSRRAGAEVTLVLCDRGAEYGEASDWACDVLLVHPADFYDPATLSTVLRPLGTELLVMCEGEALISVGVEVAGHIGADLVYDTHDDDAEVAASLGEPSEVVARQASIQQSALRTADYVIVSTRNEARMAGLAEVRPTRTALLPNGADPDQRKCWGPDVDVATLLFLGNLYYRPNALAVTSLVTEVLPGLDALGVAAKLRVIGRGPTELTQSTDRVEFAGRVDSIDEALRGATIALAPLTAGSGAKMKVLDYMAAGLPVIGTSGAVTGLPPRHAGVLVNDALTEWPSLIATLLRNPSRMRQIGRDGRACIERDLSWRQIGADLMRQAQSWLMATPSKTHMRTIERCDHAPRWLSEHAGQGALGTARITSAGKPMWLRACDRGQPSPVVHEVRT